MRTPTSAPGAFPRGSPVRHESPVPRGRRRSPVRHRSPVRRFRNVAEIDEENILIDAARTILDWLYLFASICEAFVFGGFSLISSAFQLVIDCITTPFVFAGIVLVSATRLAFLWLIVCFVVHFTDWCLDQHGLLASTFFELLNPNSHYHKQAWGETSRWVNLLADSFSPFSVVWTTLLPSLLDHANDSE